MLDQLPQSWQDALCSDIEKPYIKELIGFVDLQYQRAKCYPPKTQIFAAFNTCKFEDVKVVIIGQDPYHGSKQANGLCFSVHNGIKHPPSLINIFKELSADLKFAYPQSGDLSLWANQGVLLLNATLTVEEGKPGSHQKKGWESFTDAVIASISDQKEQVVFMLWGGYAKKKGAKIDRNKHLVLETGHPSPLSANRGFWFGNHHFSKCNLYLKEKRKPEVNWKLEQPQGFLFT